MIEVIVQNAEEAMEAERLGVDRLELVSAIKEGGLTPSYATIKQVLNSVSIPVQIMIRPHSYNFTYRQGDKEIIYEDIRNVLYLGGKGIVFGALNDDHTIDEETLIEVIEISSELDITFHRAFDEISSQIEGYQLLCKYKEQVKRVLTSGGKRTCEEGKNNLIELIKIANQTDGPSILAGSGLTTNNFLNIHKLVHAYEYHFGSGVRKNQSFRNGFDKEAIRLIMNSH
ncbi:copper homeostasis protein CutC [Aquibacillus rhizosphaerae]|uniref:PF03932 family protein CutC n=1 Tax=Aquibacillus rhizosphaerae TaxID=3051431 RepID=A0ABT7L8B7_9BACI|nr:copper homeostasis protein CutC [Aquibacillus sp. LR5S19]MDL4842101.1 copper homeostasis protein CutC [Aquibacillus sp. LR5S19]